tara:strand:+ start:1483 stop:2373 length:891 start_codon:yes stop_codon:yes gene_type:complete
MTDKNVAKVANFFECKLCNYNTCKKSNYNKHLLTLKHINLHNTDINVAKVATFNCLCGKSYKHRQSLYTHQSKCTFKDNENVKQDLSQNLLQDLSHDLTQNLSQEFVLNVIKKQQDQITELTNTIKEMAPLINSNTINNNQKFNINVFLNEQCKDAINMSDFIKSLKVNLEELDVIKENGLAEGISKTIITNMSKLSIYERPLHCTDIKRETLYIKENDNWRKDNNKEKIKEAIKKTSSKNYSALQEWKESNPDYMNNEDKTDYFTKTVSTLGKLDNNIDNKIIKNICKETYVKES